MKRPTIVMGVLFILLGLVALIHPRIQLPARKTEVEVAGQRLLIETRRIVTIPSILGGLLIVAGASFMILGPRRR